MAIDARASYKRLTPIERDIISKIADPGNEVLAGKGNANLLINGGATSWLFSLDDLSIVHGSRCLRAEQHMGQLSSKFSNAILQLT